MIWVYIAVFWAVLFVGGCLVEFPWRDAPIDVDAIFSEYSKAFSQPEWVRTCGLDAILEDIPICDWSGLTHPQWKWLDTNITTLARTLKDTIHDDKNGFDNYMEAILTQDAQRTFFTSSHWYDEFNTADKRTIAVALVLSCNIHAVQRDRMAFKKAMMIMTMVIYHDDVGEVTSGRVDHAKQKIVTIDNIIESFAVEGDTSMNAPRSDPCTEPTET
jgi:hypothetical protein